MAAVRCGVPAGAQRVVALGAARCPNAQGSVVSEWMAAAVRGAFAVLVQRLVMLSLGVIYSVGLSLVGLEPALFLGMLAGLASIVPYLGVIVGISLSTVIAYIQFQEFLPVVYVLLVFGVGQVLESSFLTPMLVGNRIGLHPVGVIFAVLAVHLQPWNFHTITLHQPILLKK